MTVHSTAFEDARRLPRPTAAEALRANSLPPQKNSIFASCC